MDVWHWNAGSGLERLKAAGHDRMETVPVGGVQATGQYRDGQYRVILRRPPLGIGEYVPVAFYLWDGAHGEAGLRMAISSWSYLLLQPETPLSVYLWPGVLALMAFAGETALARHLRRSREESL